MGAETKVVFKLKKKIGDSEEAEEIGKSANKLVT